MIVDARNLADGTVVETDLCVVGAGAAGITLGLEFAGQAVKVAVVESGGFEPDPQVQSLYQGVVAGFPYRSLDTMRLRYFGGSTNHWAGNCRPLDEIDFLYRSWLPHSGWPFTRPQLDGYYQRAQGICGLGGYDYGIDTWAKAQQRRPFEFDPQKLLTGITQKSAPLRFGSAYRGRLERARNITIYQHGNIVEIETIENSRHVTGVRGLCLTGTAFKVIAKVYVLAAGGIESARLLLASDGVQRGGLGNAHGLVGRFFMEHPHGFAGKVILSDQARDVGLYQAQKVKDSVVRAVLTLSPELLFRERLTNLYMNLGGSLHPSEGEQSASAIGRGVREWDIPDDLGTHVGNVIADLDEVAVAAYRRITRRPDSVGALWVHCRVEPIADPASRIKLMAQTDRLGMRKIQLSWNPGELALKSLYRGMALLAEECGRVGLGRVMLRLDMESENWPVDFKPSGHHIGTTRMHERASRGVVNADCLVHDVDNLYIAGSSVFPTAGCNNPTLTIVALTLRLADHLSSAVL